MGRDRQRNSAKPPKHMGFGPIVVDWACSLQKNKKRFRRHILMPCMELLALLKYPFCYTIWRGFGKFFGMIHVLTRHLEHVVFWQEIGACCVLAGNWTFSEMF